MEFAQLLKKIECGNSRGQKKEVEFTRVIKNKLCGISMGRGFWPWKFQWISHNVVEYPGVKLNFAWNFEG